MRVHVSMLCAQMMTNLHLAPFPRPVSSLIADYPQQQGDHGWQVGLLGRVLCRLIGGFLPLKPCMQTLLPLPGPCQRCRAKGSAQAGMPGTVLPDM